MKINPKDIENFVNVANYQSLSKASKMLDVSQPTLSESIKKLEKAIAAPVFYRSKAGIQLTNIGQQALNSGHKILSELDHLRSLAAERDPKLNREFNLRLGCHPVIATYFLSTLLSKFHDESVNFNPHLIHGHSINMQKQVQDGLCDVAIVVNPVRNPDLVIKRICFDTVAIWGKSKKAKLDRIICDLDLVQTQSLLKKWKREIPKTLHTPHFELIHQLVKGGFGYGILPERVVKLYGNQIKMLEGSPTFSDEFCLMYRPEFGHSKLEKLFISLVKESF